MSVHSKQRNLEEKENVLIIVESVFDCHCLSYIFIEIIIARMNDFN